MDNLDKKYNENYLYSNNISPNQYTNQNGGFIYQNNNYTSNPLNNTDYLSQNNIYNDNFDSTPENNQDYMGGRLSEYDAPPPLNEHLNNLPKIDGNTKKCEKLKVENNNQNFLTKDYDDEIFTKGKNNPLIPVKKNKINSPKQPTNKVKNNNNNCCKGRDNSLKVISNFDRFFIILFSIILLIIEISSIVIDCDINSTYIFIPLIILDCFYLCFSISVPFSIMRIRWLRNTICRLSIFFLVTSSIGFFLHLGDIKEDDKEREKNVVGVNFFKVIVFVIIMNLLYNVYWNIKICYKR